MPNNRKVGFNKETLRFYNCHESGHFARECTNPTKEGNTERALVPVGNVRGEVGGSSGNGERGMVAQTFSWEDQMVALNSGNQTENFATVEDSEEENTAEEKVKELHVPTEDEDEGEDNNGNKGFRAADDEVERWVKRNRAVEPENEVDEPEVEGDNQYEEEVEEPVIRRRAEPVNRNGRGRDRVNRAERPERVRGIPVNRGDMENPRGQRGNYIAPAHGVNSRFRPAISDGASPLVPQERVPGQQTFKSRPSYINIVPHFHGMASEDPYSHLTNFSAICGSIGDGTFDQDEVRLRLFQFSLKDKAKVWFNSLPTHSIRNWAEMQQLFLNEFYSQSKTTKARSDIRHFSQLPGELFHEAFTRYKDMIRKCPHHQIELWELVKCFVDGLTYEDQKHLKASCNSQLLNQPEEDDWEYL
ncbi:uncharacterized protein LOC143619995 [Bidens hawaiensis]|uniref:uncharacterized protein LOC143619995 n=1 Tax=Bidens hawaiensis TaxID=980011 RepID=UPI00404A170B